MAVFERPLGSPAAALGQQAVAGSPSILAPRQAGSGRSRGSSSQGRSSAVQLQFRMPSSSPWHCAEEAHINRGAGAPAAGTVVFELYQHLPALILQTIAAQMPNGVDVVGADLRCSLSAAVSLAVSAVQCTLLLREPGHSASLFQQRLVMP